MAKTIFLKVRRDDLDYHVRERSFHVQDCALLRQEPTAEKRYCPVIVDYKANKSFIIVGVNTDEEWEALKKLFAE